MEGSKQIKLNNITIEREPAWSVRRLYFSRLGSLWCRQDLHVSKVNQHGAGREYLRNRHRSWPAKSLRESERLNKDRCFTTVTRPLCRWWSGYFGYKGGGNPHRSNRSLMHRPLTYPVTSDQLTYLQHAVVRPTAPSIKRKVGSGQRRYSRRRERPTERFSSQLNRRTVPEEHRYHERLDFNSNS